MFCVATRGLRGVGFCGVFCGARTRTAVAVHRKDKLCGRSAGTGSIFKNYAGAVWARAAFLRAQCGQIIENIVTCT